MSRPCPYCGETGREMDRDREPRPMWVCAGCGLTWDEARELSPQAPAPARRSR